MSTTCQAFETILPQRGKNRQSGGFTKDSAADKPD